MTNLYFEHYDAYGLLTSFVVFSLSVQSNGINEGVNVYAVQRAAKTSSTEAIVVAVMMEKDSLFSLALLIDLAEYLSSKWYINK